MMCLPLAVPEIVKTGEKWPETVEIRELLFPWAQPKVCLVRDYVILDWQAQRGLGSLPHILALAGCYETRLFRTA